MSPILQEKLKKPITRSYEFEPGRRSYEFEPSRNVYSRALSTATKADFFLEIDEDTFIVGEAKETECERPGTRPNPEKPVRGHLLKRYRLLKARFRRLHCKAKPAAKKASIKKKPPSAAVLRIYKGYVDAVHDGLAYLILENQSGQRLEIEWDAADLSKEAIGERQPFVLKTLSIENELKYEFIPDRLRPLPKELKQNIADLLSHYRATGDLDDDNE
jgi:hypothetical protein